VTFIGNMKATFGDLFDWIEDGVRLYLWSKEFSSPDNGGLGKSSILPSWLDMTILPAY